MKIQRKLKIHCLLFNSPDYQTNTYNSFFLKKKTVTDQINLEHNLQDIRHYIQMFHIAAENQLQILLFFFS